MSKDNNIRVFCRVCPAPRRWYILVYVRICIIEHSSSAVSDMPFASDVYQYMHIDYVYVCVFVFEYSERWGAGVETHFQEI